MIDADLRKAIFTLRDKEQSVWAIARALQVSRNTVRWFLRSGKAEPPERGGPDQTEPHLPLVRDLFTRCAGNRVRVKERAGRAKDRDPVFDPDGGLAAPEDRRRDKNAVRREHL